MWRRIMAGTLAIMMSFSAAAFAPVDLVAYAKNVEQASRVLRNSSNVDASSFHYDQLDALSKAVYDGIHAMYEQGILKTGVQDYDLVANGHLSEDDLQAIAKDSSKLKTAMNAARYAFYADYPEVFYVNFPKLTFRTTKDDAGASHVYLGSGRNADYYIDGFSSESEVDDAVAAFDARVDEIVEGAQSLEVPEGKNAQVEQIRYVHNEIVDHVSYRMEDTCFEGNDEMDANTSYLGTPYGTLVKKQGVCEGYARAFKAVMDRMGINSILVQGVHQYDSEVAVSHMWNYVEIDAVDENTRSLGGKWYAMDLTQDDPEDYIIPEKELVDYTQHFEEYGKDGFENEKYFLAGQLTLNGRHFIDETVDAAGGYTFTYPSIEDADYGVREAINTMDGFSVKQKTVTGGHGLDVTEFQISYKGMNVTTARKEGIYILARYYDEDEEGNVVPLTGWCYFSDSYEFKEDDTSVYLQEGEVQYMEFAATTVVPREGLDGLTYAGDDLGLIARTGKIYNENQNDYDAPPFILRATPSQTATIFPGASTYHIRLEYDETLMLEEGVSEDDLSMMIKCSSNLGNEVTGAEYSKVSNVTWDGDKIVEFDVQFSQMFADDNVNYNFYPQGLIGSESKKAPNPACYGVANRTECPCVQDRRGSWELYAKPTLLEDTDLSVQDWTLSNGKAVSDKLTNRIALVTTKTSAKQESQMQQALDRDLPGESEQILESSTFNITLSVCKSYVVKTGHKLKVKVGFPTGYGPEDEGVTFKAYHFKRDAQGNVTGVEEIDCVVTPYGLIITCDAFSPFTIAAVEKDAEDTSNAKSVVVTASDGGQVTGENLGDASILNLTDGDFETLHVTPDEGYEIESVTICGKDIDVTDPTGMDLVVGYVDAGVNNIVHVNFVAKSVVEKEAERGEEPVKPEAEPAVITMPESMEVSDRIHIAPSVTTADGVHSYQWYKDGKKLEGANSLELDLEGVTEQDAGRYQLQVTTIVDTVSTTVMSDPCVVTVQEQEESHTHVMEAVAAKDATHKADGNIAHFVCKDCGKLFADEEGERELSPEDVVVKQQDHVFEGEYKSDDTNHWQVCECGEASEKEAHKFGDWKETKAPTATEAGSKERVCETCDYHQVEEIPATGEEAHTHVMEAVAAKDATHKADGNIAHFVCKDCGKLFADEEGERELSPEDVVVKQQDHVFEGEYKSDDTNHWQVCECGEASEKEAHAFGDWKETKAPTATEAGSKERVCETCDYHQVEEIPATGEEAHTHVMEAVAAKDATHKADGNIAHFVCKDCGKLFADEEGERELSPEDVVVKQQDHVFEGEYESDDTNHWQVCECGEASEKEVHKFGDWKETKAPTATEAGSKERVCETCDYHQVEEIPATGEEAHTHVMEAVAAKDATHKADGNIAHFVCKDCGKLFADEEGERELSPEDVVVKQQDHVFEGEYKSDDTNHWQVCECGEASEKEAHKFGDWKETKAPTATEAGSKERVCETCDYHQVEEIPATGEEAHTHVMEAVAAKDATHKADGNIAHFVCKDCGKLFVDEAGENELKPEDVVVKQQDHVFEGEYKSDDANHWQVCECGEASEKEAHKFGDWKETKAPTATEAGSKERVCETCDYHQVEEIPATGEETPVKPGPSDDPDDTQRPVRPGTDGTHGNPSDRDPSDSNGGGNQNQTDDKNDKNDRNQNGDPIVLHPDDDDNGNDGGSSNSHNPSNPSNPTGSGSNLKNSGQSPKTGDLTNLSVWLGAAALSVGAMITAYGRRLAVRRSGRKTKDEK